jgi:TPR repeat protein
MADLNVLAEQGNPSASLYLARIYLQKAESRPNLQAAFEHLRRAIVLPEAKYRLGSLILSGKLIDLPEQFTEQFAIDTIVEAGRALYLNAYGFLAEYFSDQQRYVYDPVYAKIFATVYIELGGFIDEQRNFPALVNELVLGDYDQKRVDDTVRRELTYGIVGWQPVAISEKDLAMLLGES